MRCVYIPTRRKPGRRVHTPRFFIVKTEAAGTYRCNRMHIRLTLEPHVHRTFIDLPSRQVTELSAANYSVSRPQDFILNSPDLGASPPRETKPAPTIFEVSSSPPLQNSQTRLSLRQRSQAAHFKDYMTYKWFYCALCALLVIKVWFVTEVFVIGLW